MTESPRPSPYEGDTLDLAKFLRSLWSGRRWVVAACVVYVAILILLAAVQVLWREQASRYVASVRLSFSGIEDGTYPDGSAFTIVDLLGTPVLSRVHAENDLLGYGLDFDEFVGALSIVATTPDQAVRDGAIRRMLGGEDLTAETRNALETRLGRSSSRYAAISFEVGSRRLPWTRTIPRPVVEKVLADIPHEWARQRTEESTEFAARLLLSGGGTRLDAEEWRAMPIAELLGRLREEFELLRANLAELDSRLGSIAVPDPVTGLGVQDLRFRADLMQEVFVAAGLGAWLSNGGVESSSPGDRYLASALARLESERDLWESKASIVGQALRRAGEMSRSSLSEGDGLLGDAGRSESAFEPGSPQFDGDFLDRLMEIVKQDGAIEYREELKRQRLDYLKRAASIAFEIDRYRSLLADPSDERDLRGGADPEEDVDPTPAEAMSSRIVEGVAEMIDATIRIARSATEMGDGGVEPPYDQVVIEQAESPKVLAGTVGWTRNAVLGGLVVAFLAGTASLVAQVVRTPPDAADV